MGRSAISADPIVPSDAAAATPTRSALRPEVATVAIVFSFVVAGHGAGEAAAALPLPLAVADGHGDGAWPDAVATAAGTENVVATGDGTVDAVAMGAGVTDAVVTEAGAGVADTEYACAANGA
jgi:hypothetical protein